VSVHQTFPRAPDKRLLTGDEAAAYCGVTLPTLRSHVKVAPMKIGGAVRYDRVALDRWIDGRTNAAPMTGDDWLDKLDED
jgi:predicted DNA-binding transcriptional regulator AlpA